MRLFDDVKAKFKEHFPEFKIRSSHSWVKSVDAGGVPAIYLEMTGFTGEGEPGTGEMDMRIEWEAEIIIRSEGEEGALLGRRAALAVSYFVAGNDFGVENGFPANLIATSRDEIGFEDKAIERWVVSFSQVARIGTNVWESWSGKATVKEVNVEMGILESTALMIN